MSLQAEEDALDDSFSNVYNPDFADIPGHLQTTRVAEKWITFRGYLDFDSVIKSWGQIPAHLVTDDLRLTAIGIDAEIIKYIAPSDTDRYLDLFIKAHETTCITTKFLHPDFRTTETVEAMMGTPSEFERSYLMHPWIAEVMTADQLESAARYSAKIMVKLPVEQISKTALHIHLTDSFWAFGLLRKEGKLRLAADFLKSGRWPESANPFERDKKEPKDALEAFDVIEKAQGENTKAVYMAWLVNQPIEQVIALMTTRPKMKLAMEMYTEDELRPLMKNNRLLKAALLEESLGL